MVSTTKNTAGASNRPTEALVSVIYFTFVVYSPGADSGEVKWVNFHPPFSEPPSFFFSYLSNIEIIFDFSDIITKIHPPFQNPGSALVVIINTLNT